MKVKLKNVLPNPFRDMDNYPIHPQKVELLKKSIESTEFWENVVARDAGKGKIELAYGHHRLVALRELYGPNHEFNWIIKKFDDEEMLKSMADENAQEWGHVSDVERETVRAVVNAYADDRIGLQMPEGTGSAAKMRYAPSFCFGNGSTTVVERPYTADTIVSFLNGTMSINTVKYTLRALCLIEQGHIKEKQLYGLSSSQCRTVVDEVSRSLKDAEVIRKEATRKAMKEAPAKAKAITDHAEEKAKQVVGTTAKKVSGAVKEGRNAAQVAAREARAEVRPKGAEMPEINDAATRVCSQLHRLLDPDYTPGSKLEELIKFKSHLSGVSKQNLIVALEEVIDYAEGYIARLK